VDARQAIRTQLELSQFVCLGYLEDLSDGDLLLRPHPGANHINWQVGHLVGSEHNHISRFAPGQMPPLPDRLPELYSREAVQVDDPALLLPKAVLLDAFRQQRAATLRLLEAASDADLDLPTGVPYAPTRGAMFAMQGSHWLMHSGQWVIVRRMLGKGAMF